MASKNYKQQVSSIVGGNSPAANMFREAYGDIPYSSGDTYNEIAKSIVGQDFALQSMAKQNEYAIEAERRANAYNDIGAQVERAERAGINKLAALGVSAEQGLSSVSGLTGGAPSGPSPSESRRNNAAAIGEIVDSLGAFVDSGLQTYDELAKVRLVNEQVFDLQSQQRLREYEISEKAFQQRMQPIREEILKNAKDKGTAEARLAQLDADIRALWLVPDEKGAIPARQKVLTTVENMKKEGLLDDAQASAYLAQAGLAEEQTRTQRHRTTLAQQESDNYESVVVEPAKAHVTSQNAQAGLFSSQQARQDLENAYLKYTGSKPGDGFEATLSGAIRGLVTSYAQNGVPFSKFLSDLRSLRDNFDSTVQSYLDTFIDYISKMSPEEASKVLNQGSDTGVTIHKGRVMPPYRSVYR